MSAPAVAHPLDVTPPAVPGRVDPIPRLHGRVPSLDGLRGIFCLVVLIHAMNTPGAPDLGIRHWIGFKGYLVVNLFFVMSGFIITTLILEERDATGTVSLRGFFFRRTVRIFPPYYVWLLVACGFWALGWAFATPAEILSCFTYTRNYYVGTGDALGHAWSLGVEEQFYLVWAPLLVALGERRAFAVGLVFMAVLFAPRYWVGTHENDVVRWFVRSTQIDRPLWGCLLAIAVRWPSLRPIVDRVTASGLAAAAALAVLWVRNTFYDSPFGRITAFAAPIDGICLAVIVWWCITRPTSVVGRILNSRPAVYVGGMSYSIYLWQQLFVANTAASARSPLFCFPWNIGLALAVSWCMYHLVDRPSQRLQRLAPRQRSGGRR